MVSTWLSCHSGHTAVQRRAVGCKQHPPLICACMHNVNYLSFFFTNVYCEAGCLRPSQTILHEPGGHRLCKRVCGSTEPATPQNIASSSVLRTATHAFIEQQGRPSSARRPARFTKDCATQRIFSHPVNTLTALPLICILRQPLSYAPYTSTRDMHPTSNTTCTALQPDVRTSHKVRCSGPHQNMCHAWPTPFHARQHNTSQVRSAPRMTHPGTPCSPPHCHGQARTA